MPSVLLQDVEQDPAECRRLRLRLEPAAGLRPLGERYAEHYLPAPGPLLRERREDLGRCLTGGNLPPAVRALVVPRVRGRLSGEAPTEPAPLDPGQVLHQLQRGPAGGQPAGPQVRLGEPVQLA